MKDISENKVQFERELESYYRMQENGIKQLPDDEFFERGVKFYSLLDEDYKKMYKVVHEAYEKFEATKYG